MQSRGKREGVGAVSDPKHQDELFMSYAIHLDSRFLLNLILTMSKLANPPNGTQLHHISSVCLWCFPLYTWRNGFLNSVAFKHLHVDFNTCLGDVSGHLNKTRVIATTLSTGGVTSSQLEAGGQLRLPSSLTPPRVQSNPQLVVKTSRNGS